MTQQKINNQQVAIVLNDLTDVDANAPTNGQVLAYDATNGSWIPSPGGSSTALPYSQIGVGNDRGVTSSPDFSYFKETGSFAVNSKPPEISAAAISFGATYIIATVGTTDFVPSGAPANVIGTVFQGNGTPGSGTGTVYDISQTHTNAGAQPLPRGSVVIRSGNNTSDYGHSMIYLSSTLPPNTAGSPSSGLSTLTIRGGQDVNVQGGNVSGSFENGGTLRLEAGVSTGYAGSNGNVRISTGGVERIRIESYGAWTVTNSQGQSGYALTSTGTSTAPVWRAPLATFQYAVTPDNVSIIAGVARHSARLPRAFQLLEVRASLVTPQATGSLITIDVKANGSSVLSTLITLDNAETTSTTATTSSVVSGGSSGTTLPDDALITIDVPQIGDGTGTGLKVTLIGNLVN